MKGERGREVEQVVVVMKRTREKKKKGCRHLYTVNQN